MLLMTTLDVAFLGHGVPVIDAGTRRGPLAARSRSGTA